MQAVRTATKEIHGADVNTVSLRIGTIRKTLALERAPLFLRFVMVGTDWNTIDALDLATDVPRDGETLYAAKRVETSNVHVDGVRKGKRFGEWRTCHVYELVDEQPGQDVMADYEAWCKWCYKQVEETP